MITISLFKTQRQLKESYTLPVCFITRYLRSITMRQSECLLSFKIISPENENMHLMHQLIGLIIPSTAIWAYVPSMQVFLLKSPFHLLRAYCSLPT